MVIEHIRRCKDKTTGYVRLENGSKTHFKVDKEYGWQQWDNTVSELYKTMPLMEKLQRELWDGEYEESID